MLNRLALGIFIVVLVSACEQEDPPSGECVADPDDERLYPLQPGAWWRHQVTDPTTNVSECRDKLVRVEALQPIPLRPEVTAYRVVRYSSDDIGVRWQEIRGEDTVRHVDEWFDLQMRRTKIVHYCPWQLRVTTRTDATFTTEVTRAEVVAVTPEDWSQCETIMVDSQTCMPTTSYDDSACVVTLSQRGSTWTRVETDDSDRVPAGEFFGLEAWMIQDEGEAPATYTWANGLGKVRESGSDNEHDVLVDCCLPSTGCTRAPPEAPELGADCP